MKTQRKYFEDSYLFNDKAKIIGAGIDDNGLFAVLDQTIFYPQGGGQPSDSGTMIINDISISVHHVRTRDEEIRHYLDRDCRDLIGAEVLCMIDPEKRREHAKLHTSGHLISNIIERLYPQWLAVKGHHFPGQSYVEFSSRSLSTEPTSLIEVQNQLNHHIEQDQTIWQKAVRGDQIAELCPNLPYTIPIDQDVRLIKIGEFGYSPCGGTHVKSLQELDHIEITKHKIKGNSMKIYYSVRHSY